MRSVYQYVISPLESRYNNKTDIDGKEFILNTDMFNHQYISREAIVLATPSAIKTEVEVGDVVIVHHNIFRRWHNVRGEEKNSSSFISENQYLCNESQIYLYKKKDGDWKGLNGYCFVSPIEEDDMFSSEKEKERMGVLQIGDLSSIGVSTGDLIGFTPSSEYEFVVDGKRMYRMSINDICLKYQAKDHKVYNPQWASKS